MSKRAIPLLLIALISMLAGLPAPAQANDSMPSYFSVRTIQLADGSLVSEMIIAGPPHPPPGYEIERASVSATDAPLPDAAAGSSVLPVPAYGWSFGCTATSAAMIAAYYDRTGFPAVYTGPTNGGVMPLDSSAWPVWTDGSGDRYDQCPLTASRLGLDGRATRGSIDDYWVAYGSEAKDPYITGRWTQHTWGDAIGDYMKTSQSTYGNSDGSTAYYYWTSTAGPLSCADMENYEEVVGRDGTYGQKRFYEARGYTVADCYNQKTDNNGGGFTFARYKAEIDAGRPVMIQLAGHSAVGTGYNDVSNTVYLHDTWDYDLHQMTWGGSYAGMALQAVSIVHPVRIVLPAVGDLSAGFTDEGGLELAWSAVPGASGYEVWHAVNAPHFVPGDDCSNPGILGCTAVASPGLTLSLPAASTTYAVRAVSGSAAPSLSTGRVGVFMYGLAPGG